MTTQVTASSQFSESKSKIDSRQARVAVIGLGYVGLPLALLFSGQKFPVTGLDIDPSKVAKLRKGKPTYTEFLPLKFRPPARQALRLPRIFPP